MSRIPIGRDELAKIIAENEDWEVPTSFYSWGHRHAWQEATILEGSYLRCLAAEVWSPSKFFINISENWARLEEFMKHLQMEVKEMEISAEMNKKSKPSWTCLHPGMYILCYFENEWYRAVINQVYPDDKQFVQVSLIDYGAEVMADMDTLRYMLKGMLDFPVQAIQCQLKFADPYAEYIAKQENPWSKDAKDSFLGAVFNKYLGVQFHERSVQPFQNDSTSYYGIWVVTVSIMAHDPEPEPLPADLNAMMREEARGNRGKTEKSRLVRARIRSLKEIDPTLDKHPCGEFSTAVQTGYNDIAVRFHQYLELPPAPVQQ